MTTRHYILFAVTLILAGRVSFLVAEIRTFTATDGRTIEAALVGKSATTATIRSASDGRDYTLPLDRFSEADREFILAWEVPNTVNVPAPGSIKEAMEQAKDSPPALESLRKFRAEKAASLLAGKGGREVFIELAVIDQTIAKVDSLSAGATARFFKKLDAAEPQLARECFVPAMQDLWKTGEVEVFAKYATDLRQLLENRLADYEAQYEVLKPRDGEALIAQMREDLDAYTRFLIQVAEAQDKAALGADLRAMTEKILDEDA